MLFYLLGCACVILACFASRDTAQDLRIAALITFAHALWWKEDKR
jgi:hypothetical protein